MVESIHFPVASLGSYDYKW